MSEASENFPRVFATSQTIVFRILLSTQLARATFDEKPTGGLCREHFDQLPGLHRPEIPKTIRIGSLDPRSRDWA
jgi:hypothetical protein